LILEDRNRPVAGEFDVSALVTIGYADVDIGVRLDIDGRRRRTSCCAPGILASRNAHVHVRTRYVAAFAAASRAPSAQ